MSRVGNKPIFVPEAVEFKADGQTFSAKGKLGELSFTIPDSVSYKLEDGVLNFSRSGNKPNERAAHGLARAMALRPEVILLDAPLTGLDPTDANSWIEILDRLAEGHPAMGGQPVTLVATADDFRPWRGHARQFAVLRHKHLRLLRHVSTDTEEHLMREMVGKDLD